MSSHLKAELAATCSTLGRLHKGVYLIEPDCLESVKDLIRYLKRDDESQEIRRYLGESKVLQNDLVHIIKTCEENSDLFDVTLRLLINLTTPTAIFYNNEIPTEKISRNIYLSLISYAQNYKVAFCDADFWSKICNKLTNLFETDWSERSADDGIQIERLLLLLRNVLQIPADEENEKRPENDITVHDKVLWALKQSQVLELLLFLSSNSNEEQYFLNLMEIFSLILREQNAKVLAQCDIHRSEIEKTKDAEDLIKVREFEKHNRNKYKNMRNFNATFIVKGVKSLSDKDVVCHKFLNKADLFKPNNLNKKQVRTRKNRIPIESERPERRSTFSIRLFLKEFCIEFLNCAFTSVMNIVKKKLVSGKSLANDHSYYFWALKFFLEFAVSINSDITLIQDIISAETFHFVQISMDDAFDHLADKKRTTDWVKRIHLILKAYHSLLETLLWMDCSKNALARSTSREIKSQIFFMAEYREMTLHILLRYDPTKFSLSYLRDIIETAHLFIKLLEEHSRQTKLVIQEVVRKRLKVKKDKQAVKESREEKWEKIKNDVYHILSSENHFPEIPPFDAALEIPIDDQKERAMKNIQKFLHLGKIRDGIGLLRSARQVWPENEVFGSTEMSVEDETVALQEICLANLCSIDYDEVPLQFRENKNQWEKNVEEKSKEEDEEEEEEEEEDLSNQVVVVEKDFDIMDYKKRLVNRKLIEGCVILLKNYKKNSDHTNHCTIKFLYRIGWECCMPAMLYQASLFWTLLLILQDKSHKYCEINTFTINLMRKFRKHATEHPVVFLDLLFWKDYKVALEIQHCYELYADKQKTAKHKKKLHTFEQRKKHCGKQKKVPDGENTGNQPGDSEKKKTEKLKLFSSLPGSDEFQVNITEDENDSVCDNEASLICFNNNSDSGDEQTVLYSKKKNYKSDFMFTSLDGNSQKHYRIDEGSKKPYESFKKQELGVSGNDEEFTIQNLESQKIPESRKFIGSHTKLSLKPEFRRRFADDEEEETDTSTWKQTSAGCSKNPSALITPLVEGNTRNESNSQLLNLKADNDSCHYTCDQRSNTPPKKLHLKTKSKGDSEFSEILTGSNYFKPKRIRYVSSDSDSYQSEDEELMRMRTKRWRKSVMVDSDSDSEEETVAVDISNK